VHAGIHTRSKVNIHYVDSEDLERHGTGVLDKVDAILVPGGFGKRGTEGKIAAVRYARENGVPYLGICLGMQLAIIEFARNVAGLEGAHSTEFDLETLAPLYKLHVGQAGESGALVIARWSYGLLQETGGILLDRSLEPRQVTAIKARIEADADNRIADIHVWKLGPKDYGAIISLVTHYPRDPAHYKQLLDAFPQLSHITIEVNQGQGDPCVEICPAPEQSRPQ
jgi:hypothetical protein